MASSYEASVRQIAMLVDGENCRPTLLASMFAEAEMQGEVTIRRIYGDWTRPAMANWKQPLQKFAFQPIQQFHHTAGKNGTDCAMIVDAMDILYSGKVNGFCLGSSDSDFTRLAIRIREQGFFVMGIGSTSTLSVLVAACDKFVYLPDPPKTTDTVPAPPIAGNSAVKPDPLPLLEAVLAELKIGETWIDISVIGARARQLDPLFRPQVYGYRQLNLMFRNYSNIFELHQRGSLYRIRVRPGTSFWRSLRNQPVVDEPVVDEPVVDEPVVDELVVEQTVLVRQPTLFDCNLGDPTGELSAGTSANRAVHE